MNTLEMLTRTAIEITYGIDAGLEENCVVVARVVVAGPHDSCCLCGAAINGKRWDVAACGSTPWGVCNDCLVANVESGELISARFC